MNSCRICTGNIPDGEIICENCRRQLKLHAIAVYLAMNPSAKIKDVIGKFDDMFR